MQTSDSLLIVLLELFVLGTTVAGALLYSSERFLISLQKLHSGFRVFFMGLVCLSLFSLIDITAIAVKHFSEGDSPLDYFVLLREHVLTFVLLLTGASLCSLGFYKLLRIFSWRASNYAKGMGGKKLQLRLGELTNQLSLSNPRVPEIVQDPLLVRLGFLLSEKNFHTLFYETPGMFISVNKDMSIRGINHYSAKAMGVEDGDMMGNIISNYVFKEDRERFTAFLQHALTGEELPPCEIRVKLQDRCLWIRMLARLMQDFDDESWLLLVCQDVSRSKEMEEEISTHAVRDNLTGLHNRHALEQYLNKIFEEQSLFSKPAALIYFDVDQFRIVNDTCGHVAGDELLKQIVAVVQNNCEEENFFARISGDEFAIVVKDVDTERAMELAETIRSATEDVNFSWDEHSFRQSISVGVALTSPRICTLTDIFGAADAACSTAKENGRNRVVLHKESRDAGQDTRSDMLWVSRIQQAFSSDRLALFFQPIIDFKEPEHNYIHYELLIRYIGDDGRYIGPDRFLPAAEKYGISNQIDLWVLTTVLDFLQNNPRHTAELSCCSINITAHSIGNHQTRSAIKVLMENLSFPTDKICFEITESSAIKSMKDAVEFIDEMRTLGCKFALDDFGTGFSSLGYLKNLDVDYLKIDGAFIRDIVDDEIDRAMVTAIADIGRAMKIKTIAEYVENEEVLKTLIPLNVDLGQGFGLAKPMPLEKAVEFYSGGNDSDNPQL